MNSENVQKNSLTEGRILGPLMLFALPVLGSLVLQAMYGAVDLLVVGKFGITADVSAVSVGAQIMNIITHTITSLSTGTTVLVGRHIGGGRKKDAGNTIGAAIILFAALGIFLTICLPLCADVICRLMNVPEAAFDKASAYLTVCGYGLLFVCAYNVLGSIFRGIGDSKTPLLSVVIACVLNIAGDIFFVRNLHLAAMGAALATVISQAVSVIICLIVISKKKNLPFEFSRESFKNTWPIIKDTIKIGMPIAIQNLIVSLSFAFITRIINAIGVVESAGTGVAEKVVAFVMLVPTSFAQSISAFVAQNYGAGKLDRAEKGLKYCIGVSLCIAFVIAYFAFFHGNVLTGIFSSDEAVIMAGWEYLKGYAIDVLLTSFMFCFVGYFNGLGKTTFVMLQGIFSATLIRLPFSIIMSRQVPISLFRMALATPCSTFCQVIACLIYFRHCRKKINELS